jgi:hypothetical protein
MRYVIAAALAAFVLVGVADNAFAQDPCCDPCKPRFTTKIVERTIQIPARTRTVRRAVFECVDVPVYGNKCTPRFREVKVPLYKTRDVPVYRCVRTPKFVDVQVPVYAKRQIQLTREVCDRCTGERTQVPCGCRSERYQSGTRTVRRRCGCNVERVQCGTRCERYQAGHQIRRVRCGTDVERVQVGTRKVRRFKEWACETIVVCPARTRTVRECVRVPCDA